MNRSGAGCSDGEAIVLFWKLTGVAALGCALFVARVEAQQPAGERPYDGIQAGVDAFRLAEEKRQAAVADQLSLNDQMRFWNGFPAGRGATIYYGYMSPAAAVAYGYAPPGFGGWMGFGPRANGLALGFEPWPYAAGRIWGYPYAYQPARQPIGQQQFQSGPNRWESHPIYDPPLTMFQPTPPVHSPLLDGTPFAAPQAVLLPVEAVPPPAPQPQPPAAATPVLPRRGPREY
jgi:hypothetical protein